MDCVDTLIHARWLLSMQDELRLLEHHSVAVHQGRIVAVLPTAEATTRFDASAVVERPQHLITPGFINAHVDVTRVFLRAMPGITHGQFLHAAADPEFVQVAAELTLIESIRSGVTTMAPWSLSPDVVAATCSAAHMRACVGLPVTDERTLWADDSHGCLTRGLEVRDEYREDPWVTTCFALPDQAHLAAQTLERIQRNADELELPVSVALDARYCGIDLLAAHRLLTPLLLVRSARELPQECLAALAAANASLIWPEGQTLRHLRDSRINVAAGSHGHDGMIELDLIASIRVAARVDAGDANSLVRCGLLAATLGGARALGLAEQTGSIEAGKWFDAACIDLHRASTQPALEPLRQYVLHGTRDAVSDVWIGGVQVLASGALTRIDEIDVFQRASRLPALFQSQH